MRIKTEDIKKWCIAEKVRPIKAKPSICVITDRLIIQKFLLDTLEGKEPMGDGNAVICIGEAMDVWQTSPQRLLQKYDVTGIDFNGWMICTPKPGNAVKAVEVTAEAFPGIMEQFGTPGQFTITGLYGEIVDGEVNVQKGSIGDFILQSLTDPADHWIVKRKIFLNTYVITKYP